MANEVKWIVTIGFDNLNWASVTITYHDRHWLWLAKRPLKIHRWRDE